MPDASGRIRDTAIQSMATMLLSLTSLYPNANLDKHPRLCVIFNNVSKLSPSKKMVHRFEKEMKQIKEEEFSEDEENEGMLLAAPTW